MSLRSILLGIAVCLVTTGNASSVLAQEDEAERLISQGVALRRQGQHEQALPYFERAYNLFPTSRSNAQLGFAKAAVGRAQEAEKHVATALADESDPWVRRNKTIIVKALSDIRASLAKLIVEVVPATASVSVNGTALPTRDPGAFVYVNPGKTEVVAEQEGFVRDSVTVQLQPGRIERVALKLFPGSSSLRPAVASPSGSPGSLEPGSAAPITAVARHDAGSGRRTGGLVLLSSGALALAGGAACMMIAGGKIDAIERDAAANEPYDEANGNFRTFNLLSRTLFVAGTAAMVGGGWLYWSGLVRARERGPSLGLFPARLAGGDMGARRDRDVLSTGTPMHPRSLSWPWFMTAVFASSMGGCRDVAVDGFPTSVGGDCPTGFKAAEGRCYRSVPAGPRDARADGATPEPKDGPAGSIDIKMGGPDEAAFPGFRDAGPNPITDGPPPLGDASADQAPPTADVTPDRSDCPMDSCALLATSLAAGVDSTCALLTDGAVRCWGEGKPVITQRAGQIVAVANARDHRCVLSSGGQVSCWGGNLVGELGNSSGQESRTPILVSGLSGVTAIAAGHSHTCALLMGGSVRCWGYNSNGQLGADPNPGSPVGQSAGLTWSVRGHPHRPGERPHLRAGQRRRGSLLARDLAVVQWRRDQVRPQRSERHRGG